MPKHREWHIDVDVDRLDDKHDKEHKILTDSIQNCQHEE
jgi:hypothetical protein